MKKLLLLFLMCSVCFGESQIQLTDTSISTLEGAIAKLHYYYKLTHDKYKDRPDILLDIEASQASWVTYHHKLLKVYNELAKGKSASAMCVNQMHIDIIKDRIRELKVFIYTQEYDVCSLE